MDIFESIRQSREAAKNIRLPVTDIGLARVTRQLRKDVIEFCKQRSIRRLRFIVTNTDKILHEIRIVDIETGEVHEDLNMSLSSFFAHTQAQSAFHRMNVRAVEVNVRTNIEEQLEATMELTYGEQN